MEKSIIAIVETTPTGIHPVSFEVIAFSERISKFTGQPITVCVIGNAIDEMIESLAASTGSNVLGISIPGWDGYNPECHVESLARALSERVPAFICVPHTAQGIDFAPVLAARMDGSCITGVENIASTSEGITFTRRILNGKKVARISASASPAVLTVQPGVFKPENGRARSIRGVGEKITVPYNSSRVERLGNKAAKTDQGSLTTAEIVIAAGNGIGDPDNLKWIETLAGCFSRAAIAGSRPVCDRKWLPYSCQVGITGALVRPRLYIACGISGATQHIAGMREAGFIVAINTDPNAAILNFADVFIIEDLRTFLPVMIERLESRPESPEAFPSQ